MRNTINLGIGLSWEVSSIYIILMFIGQKLEINQNKSK